LFILTKFLKLIGDFEGLYQNFKDPFTQSKKEKFETSKAAIINYCNLLQEKYHYYQANLKFYMTYPLTDNALCFPF
jgi:hypothetical protein